MIAFLQSQLRRLHRQPRNILQTLIYGVAAGGAAVAFQEGINVLYNHTYVRLASERPVVFVGGTFVVIVVASLLVGMLLYKCPEAAGSGIPQLKLAFWKDFGFVRARVVWVKFVAGILSIGGGNSLGREGPSVHLAGALTSNVAGALGEPKQNRRIAAAAGAAAGLAAAFNTPIAAVTFVLEEIIEDLNSRLLGSVLLAAVVGALVVHGLIGPQPAFNMATVEPSTWRLYLLIPITAALSSFVGVSFQKGTLYLRGQRSGAFSKIPKWFRPVLGGIAVWAIGCAVFLTTRSLGVFSLGYDDLSHALTNGFEWKLAGLLVLTKLAATVICYGFGGCGGIFSPTLFLGGMTGIFVAGVANFAIPMSIPDQIVLAVVGMSACLGAVVRAPITSILIVFEMTHEFSMVPALMLGTLVSQMIGRRLCEANFYEAVLKQDGHHVEKYIPPRDLQAWQQLPVSAIANFQPVLVRDLSIAGLKEILEKYSYAHFPVLENDKLVGILKRDDAEAAILAKTRPEVSPVVSCERGKSIREVQQLLIESATHTVVLIEANGVVVGMITLHDLLRAQLAITESYGNEV